MYVVCCIEVERGDRQVTVHVVCVCVVCCVLYWYGVSSLYTDTVLFTMVPPSPISFSLYDPMTYHCMTLHTYTHTHTHRAGATSTLRPRWDEATFVR